MAKFHTDEHISQAFADALTARGHDVATTYRLRLSKAPDDKHLLVAAQAGRILITHNEVDFELLHRAWMRWRDAWSIRSTTAHAGILVLPAHHPISLYGYLIQAIERLIGDRRLLTDEMHVWQNTQWKQIP